MACRFLPAHAGILRGDLRRPRRALRNLDYLARLRILDRAAEEAARNIIEAKIKL